MPKKIVPTHSKGIFPVSYTLKDGTKTTKYRVRVNKLTADNRPFKLDKLLNSLEEAEELLASTKTNIGKSAIAKFIAGEDEKKVNWGNVHKTLKDCFEVFYEQHYKKIENDELDVSSNKKHLSYIKVICETKIVNTREYDDSPPLIQNRYGVIDGIVLGSLSPLDITTSDVNYYIKARYEQGKAKSTIAREIGVLGSFFNSFYLYSNNNYKVMSENNPTKNAGKKFLKGTVQKRERRLTDEEEKQLISVLTKKNVEVYLIFAVSLTTSMRRSEVMMLRKKDVFQDYLYPKDTKNGEHRKVRLLPEAKKLVAMLMKYSKNKKPEERVFNLTMEGFKTAWQRAVKEAGIVGLRFHDMRSEFVSRALEGGFNSIVVSELANIHDQNYFERTHLLQHQETQRINSDKPMNERELIKQAGWRDVDMLKHYSRAVAKKAIKKTSKK